MNIEQARFNMIEQQIRPWEVLDQRVLDLLFVVKREDFVPQAYKALAFADMEIPLGQGQSMLSPKVEARLLQELAVKKTDKALRPASATLYCTFLPRRISGSCDIAARTRCITIPKSTVLP